MNILHMNTCIIIKMVIITIHINLEKYQRVGIVHTFIFMNHKSTEKSVGYRRVRA